MTHRKAVNLLFGIVMLGACAILLVPACASNALLHNRLTRIHRGMPEAEASRLLGVAPRTNASGGIGIYVVDRSSPLAFAFSAFEVREFHVVELVTGRVEDVSLGAWIH